MGTDESPPAIIFGDSQEVLYGIARSLDEFHIPFIFIIWQKWSALNFSKFGKKIFVIPDPAKDDAECIKELFFIGKELKNKYKRRLLIFPTSDKSLLLIEEYYKIIKKFFIFLGDPNDTHLSTMSKGFFFKTLEDKGIPIPRTHVVSLEGPDQTHSLPPYPKVVKPSEKDLNFSFYHQYRVKAIIIKNEEILQKLLKEYTETPLVIQEFIPGDTNQELSWCGYRSQNGKFCKGIIAQMWKKRPFQTATYVVAKENDYLEELSTKILEIINFWGICEIEYKFDERDHQFKVIELNPRCCLFFYLATKQGLNLLTIAYQEVYHNELPDQVQLIRPWNWISLFDDFKRAVLMENTNTPIKRVLNWWLEIKKPFVFTPMNGRDPYFFFLFSMGKIFEILRSLKIKR